MTSKTVLILGDKGQLGLCLHDTAPSDYRIVGADLGDVDITDTAQVARLVAEVNPDWVVNAAAYTAVDKAESEPELADQVNCVAVGYIAEACAAGDVGLIHISTDFVFNGRARIPQGPEDKPAPLSVYGKTKLAGERIALSILPDTIIIRTAWLYSEYGANFVKTMLKLMAEKDELSVVADQKGTPTYARGLATAIWALLDLKSATRGIYHWTDAGETTWHGFATEIQNMGLMKGVLHKAIPVKAIATDDYPTPAARPAYSVLDSSRLRQAIGMEGEPWKVMLRQMFDRLD